MSLFISTPLQLEDGQNVKGYYLSEKGKSELERLINERLDKTVTDLREIILKLRTTQRCYYPLLDKDRVDAYLRKRVLSWLAMKSMRQSQIIELFPRIFWNDAEKILKDLLSEAKIHRSQNGWYKLKEA